VLFLGHPTYAVTVVIFLLLLRAAAAACFPGVGCRGPRKCGYLCCCWWSDLRLCSGAAGLLNALVGLPFAVKLLVSG